MLRSKFHRPWQPRMSDGQLLNPSAHSTESETSFSDVVEETEEQLNVPEGAQASLSAGAKDAHQNVDSLASVAPESPSGKSGWYANLLARFAKH